MKARRLIAVIISGGLALTSVQWGQAQESKPVGRNDTSRPTRSASNIDATGQMVWQRTLSDGAGDKRLTVTPDNRILIVNRVADAGYAELSALTKIDRRGWPVWRWVVTDGTDFRSASHWPLLNTIHVLRNGIILGGGANSYMPFVTQSLGIYQFGPTGALRHKSLLDETEMKARGVRVGAALNRYSHFDGFAELRDGTMMFAASAGPFWPPEANGDGTQLMIGRLDRAMRLTTLNVIEQDPGPARIIEIQDFAPLSSNTVLALNREKMKAGYGKVADPEFADPAVSLYPATAARVDAFSDDTKKRWSRYLPFADFSRCTGLIATGKDQLTTACTIWLPPVGIRRLQRFTLLHSIDDKGEISSRLIGDPSKALVAVRPGPSNILIAAFYQSVDRNSGISFEWLRADGVTIRREFVPLPANVTVSDFAYLDQTTIILLGSKWSNDNNRSPAGAPLLMSFRLSRKGTP